MQLWPWPPGQPLAAQLAQCRHQRRRLLPGATRPSAGTCTLAGGPDFVASVANGHIVAPMAHSHACLPPCGRWWAGLPGAPPRALPAHPAPCPMPLLPLLIGGCARGGGLPRPAPVAALGWGAQWRWAGGVQLLGGVGVNPYMRPLASNGLQACLKQHRHRFCSPRQLHAWLGSHMGRCGAAWPSTNLAACPGQQVQSCTKPGNA